jgi:hypothetical protein
MLPYQVCQLFQSSKSTCLPLSQWLHTPQPRTVQVSDASSVKATTPALEPRSSVPELYETALPGHVQPSLFPDLCQYRRVTGAARRSSSSSHCSPVGWIDGPPSRMDCPRLPQLTLLTLRHTGSARHRQGGLRPGPGPAGCVSRSPFPGCWPIDCAAETPSSAYLFEISALLILARSHGLEARSAGFTSPPRPVQRSGFFAGRHGRPWLLGLV